MQPDGCVSPEHLRHHAPHRPVRLESDFVGDASMRPYEITVPGGSVEHMNEEPGALWLRRVTDIYEHCVWLNPVPEEH